MKIFLIVCLCVAVAARRRPNPCTKCPEITVLNGYIFDPREYSPFNATQIKTKINGCQQVTLSCAGKTKKSVLTLQGPGGQQQHFGPNPNEHELTVTCNRMGEWKSFNAYYSLAFDKAICHEF